MDNFEKIPQIILVHLNPPSLRIASPLRPFLTVSQSSTGSQSCILHASEKMFFKRLRG